jgi:hypothetical protein
MALPAGPGWNLGFLTVLREPSGDVGGYLVTNQWGRPLEFRLSSAVQPNRIQQILYGDTLASYVCGDLIGKVLIDKTTAQARAIVTDQPEVLVLRRTINVPVVLIVEGVPQDAGCLREVCNSLGNGFDWTEPFARIREAIAEARKLGAAK